MFLAAAEQRALWQRIARALAKAPQGTFVFDLIPVVEEWRAGRVGRLLDGLLKRATNGATYVNDNRTRHDIASDLKDAGFATVEFLERLHSSTPGGCLSRRRALRSSCSTAPRGIRPRHATDPCHSSRH